MNEQSRDRLEQLRAEMDDATSEMVEAFQRRGRIALEIALEKKGRLGASIIRDPRREKEVLEHVAEQNTGPFTVDAVQHLVQLAMDESCKLQAEVSGLPVEIADLPGPRQHK